VRFNYQHYCKSNKAFGAYALFSNTTGSNNTALGATALYANTTGVNNLAAGISSLRYNTTGGYNVALGANALNAPTPQERDNTAVGYREVFVCKQPQAQITQQLV
jgi:hypothetical protein